MLQWTPAGGLPWQPAPHCCNLLGPWAFELPTLVCDDLRTEVMDGTRGAWENLVDVGIPSTSLCLQARNLPSRITHSLPRCGDTWSLGSAWGQSHQPLLFLFAVFWCILKVVKVTVLPKSGPWTWSLLELIGGLGSGWGKESAEDGKMSGLLLKPPLVSVFRGMRPGSNSQRGLSLAWGGCMLGKWPTRCKLGCRWNIYWEEGELLQTEVPVIQGPPAHWPKCRSQFLWGA